MESTNNNTLKTVAIEVDGKYITVRVSINGEKTIISGFANIIDAEHLQLMSNILKDKCPDWWQADEYSKAVDEAIEAKFKPKVETVNGVIIEADKEIDSLLLAYWHQVEQEDRHKQARNFGMADVCSQVRRRIIRDLDIFSGILERELVK